MRTTRQSTTTRTAAVSRTRTDCRACGMANQHSMRVYSPPDEGPDASTARKCAGDLPGAFATASGALAKHPGAEEPGRSQHIMAVADNASVPVAPVTGAHSRPDAERAIALARDVLATEAAAISALSDRLGEPFVAAVA